ncbi:hypothetical protein NVP1238A_79 [Vibrio phage 1.238.A._10N.261.52.F10]|uniref:Uncharacterized protein n=2 Tax=Pariacacavirus TaxID=2948856 RepID=A0A2I7RUK1_9CAUD|nr:hypothetical protein KNT79_gp79 [Vibrio phage 1.238.A._10N.261.52.F10]YP_010093524.1 hypothetical protein KNT80_gp81 [Vibrio phage 1.245.O._10N.261.54.C7]AUR97328.1 hypothetical protein NVP1238A_79 [Vibrio phage 1.238.A._10N.261.52.F10]AUR97422.1 hypothetical protein NVP1238B_80 [Vibrio phage 1.238.B._10N.261.52.F10]AUR97994.1 hypothetical protein NVP1245O_81 [Vibrio phage 1.245.O._10N.261.54.C7]
MIINPVKYPILYGLKEHIEIDGDAKVEEGFLTLTFELKVKLPKIIAELFD